MPGDETSSQRRKLMAELRRVRNTAGLTQRAAAERLSWSQSKLIRIENGAVGVSVTDLQAMLQLYGVTDAATIEDLSDAALHSRGTSWWSGFRDVVSPQFATYLRQEGSASSIGAFHPHLIPGLLHTEEYAAGLLEPHTTGEKAHRIVQMRQQRQQSLLGREDALEAVFMFGEEALYRWIGGPAVMQRQFSICSTSAKGQASRCRSSLSPQEPTRDSWAVRTAWLRQSRRTAAVRRRHQR